MRLNMNDKKTQQASVDTDDLPAKKEVSQFLKAGRLADYIDIAAPVQPTYAGIIPLYWGKDGWEVLVLRTYKNWDFPKGRTMQDRPDMNVAINVAIKVGITDLRFPWGRDGTKTAPYSKGKVAIYFIGQTRKREARLPVNPKTGKPDYHEWRLVPVNAARRLLPTRLHLIMDWCLSKLDATGRNPTPEWRKVGPDTWEADIGGKRVRITMRSQGKKWNLSQNRYDASYTFEMLVKEQDKWVPDSDIARFVADKYPDEVNSWDTSQSRVEDMVIEYVRSSN